MQIDINKIMLVRFGIVFLQVRVKEIARSANTLERTQIMLASLDYHPPSTFLKRVFVV